MTTLTDADVAVDSHRPRSIVVQRRTVLAVLTDCVVSTVTHILVLHRPSSTSPWQHPAATAAASW